MLQRTPFLGSYSTGDVDFLLTPIAMAMVDITTKERLIQTGARHYSEMLSAEEVPSSEYISIFADAMRVNGPKLAQHINTLASALRDRAKGKTGLAIVSLVRAGTPICVLLTRALRRCGIDVAHYAISIIRGRGIDRVALAYILSRHAADEVVFVDGWTGKGAIAAELRGHTGASASGIAPFLVVVADPAGQADLAATSEDYVIPSGILGGIVSGLVSRSVLNGMIAPGMFHGCVSLDHMSAADVSLQFVDTIDALTGTVPPQSRGLWQKNDTPKLEQHCREMLRAIERDHGVRDINRIKPGIAESTRAVLRRAPYRLLLRDITDPNLQHLLLLAEERNIEIRELFDGGAYRAVAIIADALGE